MVRSKFKLLSRYDLFSIRLLPTLIVLLTLLVLIGFSWRTASRAVIDARDEEIVERARFIETSIRQRFNLYDNALRSGAGLFYSDNDLSREEWRQFVMSLDVEEQLPGLLALGYVEYMPASRVNTYEARITTEGFPGFHIRPETRDREVYTSVTYIEPFNDRNQRAFGYDMLTDPVRKVAIQKAIDSGETTMSDILPLLQDDNSRKNGVTLYYPLYQPGMPVTSAAERQAALVGFIYAPLRSSVLFGNIFDNSSPDFNFQIYDGTNLAADTLLYEQHPPAQASPYGWTLTDDLVLYDHTWTIRYGSLDTIVPESLRERPRNLAIGGTIFALIVAGFVYLLLQRRTRLIAHKEESEVQKAKDDMLSLASHQLRTPATGVKQYMGMVLEGFVGRISHEQRELLNRAYESNERQLRIINEFLYLAKAEADHIVITPQKFDLVPLIEEVVSDMKSDIADASHELQIKHRTKIIEAVADTHSARMILENLVSNAIKYTPNGGKIVITLRRTPTGSAVAVADNGVGIARKDFPKLFQQFSRIPNQLTKYTSGSGIGLYLARYLAKLNGGTITVESKKGAGSTFTAYFPRRSVKKLTARSTTHD